MKQKQRKQWMIRILAGLLVLTVGYLIGRWSSGPADHANHSASKTDNQVYTCSMHPQIRQNEPGNCPICGMELIPLMETTSNESIPPDFFQMSNHAMKLAQVQVSEVQHGSWQSPISLQGSIAIDENRRYPQTAHFEGRLEKMQVQATGQHLSKGQTIAHLFAPDLIQAQKELKLAQDLSTGSEEFENLAKEKLKFWKLSDATIEDLISRNEPIEQVPIQAEHSGFVVEKRVQVGDYVKRGDVLYTVADLEQVWAKFDAYDAQLSQLKVGQIIDITDRASGISISGNISYVAPFVSPESHTGEVRVELSNSGGLFKPGSIVTGKTRVNKSSKHNASQGLFVPKTAVLWTGKRSLVYVQLPEQSGTFALREVETGITSDDAIEILSGLEAGELVVTHGTFKVDAAAQLTGVPSMMLQKVEVSTPSTALRSLMVSGNCDMCKNRIEQAASSIFGVYHAHWSTDNHELHLELDSTITSVHEVAQNVAAAGHDNELFKANNDTYDDLPGCCQYDRNQPQ